MSAVRRIQKQAVEDALRELEERGDVALVNLVRAYIRGLEGRVDALELDVVEDEGCLRENTPSIPFQSSPPTPLPSRERGEGG